MVLVLVHSLQTKEKKRKSHFSAAAVGALTHTAHLPHHEFLRHPYLHSMAFWLHLSIITLNIWRSLLHSSENLKTCYWTVKEQQAFYMQWMEAFFLIFNMVFFISGSVTFAHASRWWPCRWNQQMQVNSRRSWSWHPTLDPHDPAACLLSPWCCARHRRSRRSHPRCQSLQQREKHKKKWRGDITRTAWEDLIWDCL